MPSSTLTIKKRLTQKEKDQKIRQNEIIATTMAVFIGGAVGTALAYLLHYIDVDTDNISHAQWEKSQAPFHYVITYTLACLVSAITTLKTREHLNKKIENEKKYIVTTEETPLLQVVVNNTNNINTADDRNHSMENDNTGQAGSTASTPELR